MSIIIDECNLPPMTFMEAMAKSVVDINGTKYLNVIILDAPCEVMTDGATCEIPIIDPERFVVQNAFGYDDCGRLALKITGNLAPR